MKQKYEFVGASEHPCECHHECIMVYRYYTWKYLVRDDPANNQVAYYEVASIGADDYWEGNPCFNYHMKTEQEGVHL